MTSPAAHCAGRSARSAGPPSVSQGAVKLRSDLHNQQQGLNTCDCFFTIFHLIETHHNGHMRKK